MAEQTWQTTTAGGLAINPGSTERVLTGAWRNQHPVVDLSKCTHCMICWIDCPDNSFIVTDGKLQGVDLDHCKGCGICSEICPSKCISMVQELQEQ